MFGKKQWDEEHNFQIKFNGRYVLNFETEDMSFDLNFYEGDYYNLRQISTIFNAFSENDMHGVVEVNQRSNI